MTSGRPGLIDNMISSGLKRLRPAAVGLVLLLLLSLGAGPLYAQTYPDPGHGFYGTVSVNGRDAPVGTVISARVSGVESGNWTVTDPGLYALIVQGDIAEGATVDFYVADQKADQTFPFGEGLTTRLNLTAPGDPLDCFIATAAYGTPTAGEIDVLREFRDLVLLENAAGRQLAALYYWVSPPAAEVISRSDFLRSLIREMVVDPIVRMVRATGHLWRS